MDKEFKQIRWVYFDMIYRCTKKHHSAYENYGARGILVCCEWMESFENFIRDMGDRPKGFLLDRRNNNLGYCKENCRWVDRKTQNNNRRICKNYLYQGIRYTMKQIWEKFAHSTLSYRAFHKRLSKSIPLPIALYQSSLRTVQITRNLYGTSHR